jgi:hypothetical protein
MRSNSEGSSRLLAVAPGMGAAVASTASFVPGLGELVAEAFDKAGKDGVITVESASAPGLGLVTGEGMTVDAARTDPDLAAGQESGDHVSAVSQDHPRIRAQVRRWAVSHRRS